MNHGTRQAKQQTQSGNSPLRGSFPPDRLHECDKTVEAYFLCLKNNENFAPRCRKEVKNYLICRKEKDLNSLQDIVEARLFPEDSEVPEFSQKEWNEKYKQFKNQDTIPGVKIGNQRFSGMKD